MTRSLWCLCRVMSGSVTRLFLYELHPTSMSYIQPLCKDNLTKAYHQDFTFVNIIFIKISSCESGTNVFIYNDSNTLYKSFSNLTVITPA